MTRFAALMVISFLVIPPLVTAGTFEEEFNNLCDQFGKMPRPQLESAWRDFIKKHDGHPRIAEAQFYLARLCGDRSTKEYLSVVKEAVENYKGAQNHFHYLYMLTTYGQVIAPEKDCQRIFREVMDTLSKGIMLPLPRWGIRNEKEAIKQLQTGAVWAEIHERTRRTHDLDQRAAIAMQVAQELSKRQDGEALVARVYEWLRTDALARGDNRGTQAPSASGDPNATRRTSGAEMAAQGAYPPPVFRKDPRDTVSQRPVAGAESGPVGWKILGYAAVAAGVALFVVATGRRKGGTS